MVKLALLFPGQGSQYVGMGRRLTEQFPAVRQVFEEADDVLGFPLTGLCFEGDMATLTRTENAQPAILTVSVAAFGAYMQEFAVEPAAGAGHSLGEYSALVCAGALPFAHALKIVHQRGRFMQQAVKRGAGAMAAISDVDIDVVEAACAEVRAPGQWVTVSNDNAPRQAVISGHKDAVSRTADILETRGARVTALDVSAPFHTPLMAGAAGQLREVLETYGHHLEAPRWPVLANVTARPYEHPGQILAYLSRQMTEPVRWRECLHWLEEQGIDLVLELGPKKVLRNLTGKNSARMTAYAFDVEADRQAFARVLHDRFTTIIRRSLALAAATRNRNWNREEYRQGVILPYQRIKQMALDLEAHGRRPTLDQANQAVEMLRSVLHTKKVHPTEQQKRLHRLFDHPEDRSPRSR